MGQIIFRMLVGAVAGFLAWLLWEPQFARVPVDPITGDTVAALWGPVEVKFVLTLSAFIGAAIGGLNGWLQGSRMHMLRGLAIGLLFGLFGGWIGYKMGGAVLQAFFPENIFGPKGNSAAKILARVLAFLPIGAFLGLGIGAGGWTLRRIAVGGTGGFFGALAAGLLFDAASGSLGGLILSLRGGAVQSVNGLPQEAGEVGQPGRAIMALLLGGFIALFIGIVDRITRSAWVRLSLGRNEGKEWVVDAPQTYMGRSEMAQIPLMGDPNVAPMHACIAKQGQAYMLMDGGSPIGTYLNGQRIQQAPLFDGARIQIGPFVLDFMLRQGSAPQRAAEAYRSQPYGIPQAPAPGQAAYGGTPQPGPMPQAMPGAPVSQMPYPGQPGPAQGYSQQPMAPMVPPGQPTTAFPAQPPMPQSLVPPQARSYVLTAVDGPLAGQRFDVRSAMEMGREASGIRLGFDSAASRRHASVSPAPDGLGFQDLGSTNGTFLNGQKTQAGLARPGDVLKVGSTSFRVEAGS